MISLPAYSTCVSMYSATTLLEVVLFHVEWLTAMKSMGVVTDNQDQEGAVVLSSIVTY
jgi:hypothetical protein